MKVDLLVPEQIRAGHGAHRASYARTPATRPMGIGRTLVALRADGTTFPAEISLSPVEDAGEPLAIAVVRDVTDYRRIERERARRHAELAAERAKLAAVLEHLPLGVLFAEAPSGRLSFGNARAAAIVGAGVLADRDDEAWPTSGKPLQSGPDSGLEALGLAHVLDRGDAVAPRRISWSAADRDPSVLETRAAPIYDDAGGLLGAVAVFEDVTDREAGLAARREAEAALAREHALLDAVLTHLPDPVYVKDANARYLRVNPAAAVLLGLSNPAEVDGASDRVVQPVDRAAGLSEHERGLLSAGLPSTELEQHTAPDGDRWLLATRVPLRDANGAHSALLAVVRDVTVLKQAEADMRRARDAAEAASRAATDASRTKSRFLSTKSHELRTPLTAILGYADLLLEGLDGELTPDQAADVGRIAAGGQRLLCLVNDVLDLSRIEAGMMPLDLEAVDLSSVALAVGEDVAPQAADRGLRLLVEVPANLPAVMADRRRLHQILLNLVGNAVKFTDGGKVAVAARAAGSAVEISVADTGIGIEPEVLPHVFDEFRQADGSATRRYEGTGLGLAITRRLVELHAGEIRAESTPGVGSTLTVALPSFAPASSTAVDRS